VRGPFLLLVTLTLLPLALVPAVLVTLVNTIVQRDPRKVFFRQERIGRRGRPFVLLKFRTMRDVPGDDHARVTRFGRFLRNTHLDELPQLVNVLRGEMCLIGPRPEMPETELWAGGLLPAFSERLVLAPGVTGLAQITQGYTDSGDVQAYREKLALNERYRATLSFARDVSILWRTALWMLRGRGWRR
jgi:lipopolysaccharide/colanic/teichoic acid biosynthesis glycosyltransferase